MLTVSGSLKTEQFVLDGSGYHRARSVGPQKGGSLLMVRSYAFESTDTASNSYTASYNDTKP